MNPGLAIFDLAFQASPIIFTGGGITTNIPGGALPIIAITEAVNFPLGLLTGGNVGLDDFFANFQPLPGTSLIDNQVGTYPFANQAVAANAIIMQPLAVSMLMTCPAKGTLGYAAKLATMIMLQSAFQQHNATGGTYTVITPSYFYTNCIMTGMRDISDGSTRQPQPRWQIDFVQPLITLQQAQQVQNSLMAKLTAGTQINGQPSWSGLSPTVGQPNSLAGPALIPPASGVPGTNVAPLNPAVAFV